MASSESIGSGKLTMAEKLAAFKAQRTSLLGAPSSSSSCGSYSGERRTSSVPGRLSGLGLSSGRIESENRNPNHSQQQRKPTFTQLQQNSTPPVTVRRRSVITSSSPRRATSPVLAASVPSEWSFSDCRNSPSPNSCSSDANSDDSYVTAFERPQGRRSSSSKSDDDVARSSLQQVLSDFKKSRRSSGSFGSVSSLGSISDRPESGGKSLSLGSASNSALSSSGLSLTLGLTDGLSPLQAPPCIPPPLLHPRKSSVHILAPTPPSALESQLWEKISALESRLVLVQQDQSEAEERAREAEERSALSLQDVEAHRFLNSLLEQQLSVAADALQSDRLDRDEQRASSRRHKTKIQQLQAENAEQSERANALIAQMTDQMAQLQSYALERIGKLEEELLEEQSKSGALESELAIAKAAVVTSVLGVTAGGRQHGAKRVSCAAVRGKVGRIQKAKARDEEEDDEEKGSDTEEEKDKAK